jgi:hypothetical protein
MYSTEAVSRPEISAHVEQAKGAERFYIGTKIFTICPKKKRTGRYPLTKLTKSNAMKRQQTKRSSSGSYNETSQEHGWDTYDCEDRGLKQRVDDSKAEEMEDFFSVEKMAAQNVTRKCKLDFEYDAAQLLMNASNFSQANGSVAYTEANLDTIDLPKDLGEAIDQVTGRGEVVNTIVMSYQVWLRLRRTEFLLQYLYGKVGDQVKKRVITPGDLEEAFSQDAGEKVTVLLGRAKYDAANRGRNNANLQNIWSNDQIWVGQVAEGDFENGGVGRTIVWDADIPTGLFATETYRDEDRRSDMVRVRTNSVEKIINENAGHLLGTRFA